MRTYEETFNTIIAQLLTTSTAKHIYGHYTSFCDHIQYVRLDALNEEDYPNGIAQNSIFIIFSINFQTKKVELHSCGHVWLSPSDKESAKYRYLAMKSMVHVHTDMGGKKFRKSSFKDVNDLVNKINTYYANVMESVTKYSGGYPYKQGI